MKIPDKGRVLAQSKSLQLRLPILGSAMLLGTLGKSMILGSYGAFDKVR
jgi:hypothetical protein